MSALFSRNLLALSILSASVPTMAQEHSLNELVIIGDDASASALPGSAHVVTSEDLETMKYTDIHKAVREVPGVYLKEEDGYGLRPNIGIRGSGSGRSSKITLMEDNVMIAPAPYSAPAAYYSPTFGRMNGIEVLKGPDLLRYGPYTVGGAINLRSTPIPSSEAGHVTTEISENAGKRIHSWYGNSTDNAGFVIETFQDETNGFKELQQSSRDTGFEKQDYVAKARFNSDASADVYHQLDLKFQYSEELSNETYLGLTDDDFRRDPNKRYFLSQLDNMDNRHKGYSARHLVELTEDLSLTTTIYRNEFKRNWYKGNFNNLIEAANNGDQTAYNQLQGTEPVGPFTLTNGAREYLSQGIEVKADYGLTLAGMRHDITIGARVHEDEADRFQPKDRYEQVINNGRPAFEFVEQIAPTGGDNRIDEAEALNLFFADRIAINPDLTLTALLRYEDIETSQTRWSTSERTSASETETASNNTSEVLPGLGATYRLTPTVTLIGGVHRGMAPAGSGGTNVEPELSTNFEAGARYNDDGLRAEAIVFYSDYENTVRNCSIANPCSAGNQIIDSGTVSEGESKIQGIELLAASEFTLANGLTAPVQATWTYTNAEVTKDSDDGSVRKGDNLADLPENVVSVRAGLRDGNLWDAYVNISYVDETCINNSCDRSGTDNTFRKTDDYTVVDLSSSYALNSSTRVYAKVDNVLDDQEIVSRSPHGARPNLPRTAYVGISVDF
ncbi:TonB-dependent receptor [Marinobacter sp. M3C]|jgi:Fe(3+) dicitrate transport protein|uniref:TonB-dependent receptor family protein n=1 Tax=unclassified Marinobacter TaxID=83889 RepID=UPI00200E6BE4|nr:MULTISPECIES: TonB-dependent receptor [unclassified Marinobacter]MCL1476287.1 TonB-dependent receptor [Marinobacter sp.]MCL1480008.1 TonB-dependent receptor [Marinobacter sp.]MCL1483046.1 TonB-dependent receptor [Marinobacter sp.]UQG58061.1 TonB-dependent receptor [Marinobacter sp. M4C]UQG60640.1 TonB-dependent receptor [Marinobacter sp. M3C]